MENLGSGSLVGVERNTDIKLNVSLVASRTDSMLELLITYAVSTGECIFPLSPSAPRAVAKMRCYLTGLITW